MTTADRVREKCREVVDPCSAATGTNLNVVEMGLLKSIDIDEGHVDVQLRLTTPSCHMVPYFAEEIEDRVSSLPDVESVTLVPDHGFEWTPEMMSEDAKRRRNAVLEEHKSRYTTELKAE